MLNKVKNNVESKEDRGNKHVDIVLCTKTLEFHERRGQIVCVQLLLTHVQLILAHPVYEPVCELFFLKFPRWVEGPNPIYIHYTPPQQGTETEAKTFM